MSNKDGVYHPEISIIVPVYNMERYLRQCVDSILAQTFTDWELLLVNDGSKDASAQICDEYAAKDARIKVVHKQNSGQADSRNIALQMAEADLIGFVDSDDWIDPDMYEVLYRTMQENDADISVCGHYLSYVNSESPSCPNSSEVKVYGRDEALQMVIDDREIKSYLVDKLYRKHVINALLPKSFYYEDYATMFKWFTCATRVAICESPKYHYRQRQGSTDHDHDPRKKYHFFLAEKERNSYLTEKGIFPEQHSKFAAKVVRTGLREIKGIVRKCASDEKSKQYVETIKSEIRSFLPIKCSDIGLIRWILLKLLFSCPSVYHSIMTLGKSDSRIRCDSRNLYE